MTTNVKLIIDGEGGKELATGTYSYCGETHYLVYELPDPENDGFTIHTMLAMTDEKFRLIRKTTQDATGKNAMGLKMEMSRTEDGSATYHTPYGTIRFLVKTQAFLPPAEDIPDKLIAEYRYALYAEGDTKAASVNRLKIIARNA